jgi:hypothetical protein
VKSQPMWRFLCVVLFSASAFLPAKNALAEKIVARDGDWTVFIDGRQGAFVSAVKGDGFPQDAITMGHDSTGASVVAGSSPAKGGGNSEAASEQGLVPGTTDQYTQGTIERMRIRSGMISNTLGIGVRGPVTAYTTVKAYMQIWTWVESASQVKTALNYADIRQGYVKLEGPWGSLLVGRSRGLFSRGATDIDVLYGHGYGVGYPGGIDTAGGPTQGQIGFGLLGSGFAAGVVYATPVLSGLQLSVGAFDPVQLQGAWPRTKWARPEAELTFEQPIADLGKVVLFGNGTYQRAYKNGYSSSGPSFTAAKGVTYGGRLELGPVHLGLSGLYGYGLGLNYALEVSDASMDLGTNMRKSDGYYVQAQVAVGKVDLMASWGITRIFLTDYDNTKIVSTVDPTVSYYQFSVIKHQMGTSCGAVYHARPWLHIDVDYFRADFAWFLGQKQIINVANAGMMFTW